MAGTAVWSEVMAHKIPSLKMSPAYAAEINAVAANTQRSVAFVAWRALLAAPDALDEAPTADDAVTMVLQSDGDDPRGIQSNIVSAAGKRPLDQALRGAWAASRGRFAKWMAREEEARQAEAADDLDRALAEALNAATPASRLAFLATSEYPRVRALVAGHSQTPADALAKLIVDREPYVRKAVEQRG